MLNISKQTKKLALRHGFELTLEEGLTADGSLLLCFWGINTNADWLFSYQHTGHQLVWNRKGSAPGHVVSELPKVLDSEAELRDMFRVLGQMVSLNYRDSVKSRLEVVLPVDACEYADSFTASAMANNQNRNIMNGMAHMGPVRMF